ncbi:putative secreted RxLR effector protein [Phytophthora cinnamomi]|uniref:putative secreted RxLR effector protein n=1 Tax=Phytophthora cinnamomi TaxID=4785 RepID=UPI003559AA6C|nr:putative secreted RxLR effector protein [Phytophthora cinnamomi]
MRVYLVLLLAVVALFSVVSGSAANLHVSQNLIQSTEADELETTQGRLLLRTAAKTDKTAGNEERGIMDAVTKLGKSTAKWPKNTYHKLYVNFKSAAMNIGKTSDAFLKKSFINPDKVYKWLNLRNGNNGHERRLWELYAEKYKLKYPDWVGKYS